MRKQSFDADESGKGGRRVDTARYGQAETSGALCDLYKEGAVCERSGIGIRITTKLNVVVKKWRLNPCQITRNGAESCPVSDRKNLAKDSSSYSKSVCELLNVAHYVVSVTSFGGRFCWPNANNARYEFVGRLAKLSLLYISINYNNTIIIILPLGHNFLVIRSQQTRLKLPKTKSPFTI